MISEVNSGRKNQKSDWLVGFYVITAVFFWGGNNVANRYLVQKLPLFYVGWIRTFLAGLALLAILKWTNLLGVSKRLTSRQNHFLWWKGGLTLAAYIFCFNMATRYTSASHVALYMGATPLWGLLWEEKPSWSFRSMVKYLAAILAVAGVIVLFWPTLDGEVQWVGESFGIVTGFMWTFHSRQSRELGDELSGVELTAHSMWRCSIWLSPFVVWELWTQDISYDRNLLVAQIYSILGGSLAGYILWYTSLRYWPVSRSLLFYNLIAPTTMLWAYFLLGERVSPTFWIAMCLVGAGILILEWNNSKDLKEREVPEE